MKSKRKLRQTEIGEIPEGWKTYPFPEVIDFQEGPGILAKDFRDNGIPLVRLAGLNKGASSLEGCNYLDPELVEQRYSHFKIKKGDILLSTSASLGRTAVVDEKSEGAVVYTGIIRMRPVNDILFAPFIKYLLEAPNFQKQIEAMGVGSVIRHFGPLHLKQMTVTVPSIQEQRAIAKILSDLDEKIELNNQMNKTLESIAQAIFKRWFVDFEFPGHEKVKFVNGLPEGWHKGGFGELAKLQPGYAFKSIDFTTTGYRVIKIANIQSGVVDFSQSDYITEEVFQKTDNKFYLTSGDVVIAMTGAEIGKIGIIPKTDEIILLNQRVGKLLSDYYLWAYYMLKGTEIQSLIDGISSASSAQPNISNSDIEKTEVIIPDEQILKSFCQIADPLFQYLISNLGENQTLSQIRDSLLPKLMSGKIRANFGG